MFRYKFSVMSAVFAFIFAINFSLSAKPSNLVATETINYTVSVTDKNSSLPLQYVNVIIKENNTIIAQTITNHFGRAIFKDIPVGNYNLNTHFVGYQDYSGKISVDTAHKSTNVAISEGSVQLSDVVVGGERAKKASSSIDINTGRQSFEIEAYHPAPNSSMTQMIVQNLAGAVKAPTGEVHIRGQHGEFSYLVDGIPIPLGVFGGLNEIVDPKVVSNVTFMTSGFSSEYGGQIAGLMDIQNRVPAGDFHLDFSTNAGSYLTSANNAGDNVGNFKALNSNGQSLSFSSRSGRLGVFFAGSRQETDRRIDQPAEYLTNDHGFDYFTYGKIDYLLGENDYLTANLNYSKTLSQIPFDSTEGINKDRQSSYNAFQTISYYHTFSAEVDRESSLFIGGFLRQGGMKYMPNVNDATTTQLPGDTVNNYAVKQNRSFITKGLRLKYEKRFSHQFLLAAGANYSYTNGDEDYTFFNELGDKLKNSSEYSGYDFGAFVQSEVHPFEWTKIDLGVRYDIHHAPELGNPDQISPRAKIFFFIDELNTVTLSYDRLFMPTNIESLGSLAAILGSAGAPSKPERDNLYEIAYTRNWKYGINTKLAAFHKYSTPGLDDETLGSSTVRVNVNVDEVTVNGIEFALSYDPQDSPFSGFINSSIIHAFGKGPVSGGFLPADEGTDYFDLDHDQRLSASFGVNYQPSNWFVNLSALYNSGLTNGNEDYAFKTGLFNFNQGAHTTPSWIFNVAGGYTFNLGNGQTLEPSLYVNNIFDHSHLIKGAFFSGASFEERRNVNFKISYHL